MGVETMPKPVASRILENIFFAENLPAGDGLDLACHGDGVVHGPERVRKRMELAVCELRRYVVRKARTEECDMARVVNLEICGGDVDSREEIHIVNIEGKTFSGAKHGVISKNSYCRIL